MTTTEGRGRGKGKGKGKRRAGSSAGSRARARGCEGEGGEEANGAAGGSGASRREEAAASKAAGAGGKAGGDESGAENELDPIMLVKVGKHHHRFVRPNGRVVLYNLDSLVDYFISTGDFLEPETRLPFSDEELRIIDMKVNQRATVLPRVVHHFSIRTRALPNKIPSSFSLFFGLWAHPRAIPGDSWSLKGLDGTLSEYICGMKASSRIGSAGGGGASRSASFLLVSEDLL